MKKISCAVVLINQYDEILVAHVTGQKFYDIPKGEWDKEIESEVDCVIRECVEETSIMLNKDDLNNLGQFSYNKVKDINLFYVKVEKENIELEKLKCESFFENKYTKKQMPEVDGYKWLNFNNKDLKENMAPSMSVLLCNVLENILESNKVKMKKPKV